MKPRRALWFAACGTALYLGALAVVDARNEVFGQLPLVATLLPALAALSLASYALRYARWQWLLRRAGHATPWGRGFLAYLSGFAFTATPGKVGELVRIRYLLRDGVPPATVLGAFVFERALDLVALLLLAALGIRDAALFGVLAGLVGAGLLAIAWLGLRPGLLGPPVAWLRRRGLRGAARLLRTLQRGLHASIRWVTPADLAVALPLGLAAWTLSAGAFVWLMSELGVALAAPVAWALYPTAMLAGAASMIPGGVGATEAAIVALLVAEGVSPGLGIVAAIAIRLAGLWFAIGCGLLAIALLERRAA